MRSSPPGITVILEKHFRRLQTMMVPDKNGYFEENGVISFFSRGGFSSCGLYLEVPKKEVLSGLSEMRLFLIGILVHFCDGSAVGAVAFQSCMWPLKSMTSTVEKVGDGDLSLRTKV